MSTTEASTNPWTRPPTKVFQLPRSDRQEDGHTGAVYSIHLVDNHLISCGVDRIIRIWDVESRQLVRAIEDTHAASIISAWYDKGTDSIISGGVDGSITVWRFSTGEFVKRIVQAHAEGVLNVRCDSRYIVSGSKDRSVKLWDRNTYELKWTAMGHTAAVNAVRMLEKFVVSSSGDRSIRVWKIKDGGLVRVISGHMKGVASIEIQGDMEAIVSGSSDETVRIWDGLSGRELAVGRAAHSDLIRNLALKFSDKSPTKDGEQKGLELERILSGSYDGSVVIWKKGPNDMWELEQRLTLEEAQRTLTVDGSHSKDATGKRVYSVQCDNKRVFSSSEAGVIIGWEFE